MELLYNQKHKCYVWKANGPQEQLIAEVQGFKLHKLGAFTTKDPMKAYSLIDYAKGIACRKLMAVEDNIESSWDEESRLAVPSPNGLFYKPFQLAGIGHCLGFKYSMIADQPGLGKTIQFAGLANYLRATTFLIIVPAHLRRNWFKEMKKWLIFFPDLTVVESKGQTLTHSVIISYELLGEYYDQLIEMKFDIGTADECQYLKSPESIRSKLVLGLFDKKRAGNFKPLFKRCQKFVFLTGTPIANRSNDFWSILAAAAPHILESRRYWGFVNEYCKTYDSGYGISVVGSKNEEGLYNRLRSGFMIRRLKKDVLKQLPGKQYKLVVFDETGKLHAVYNQTEDFTHAQVLDLGKPADYAINPTVRREEGIAKVPIIVKYIRDMLEAGVVKPLILAYHIEVIEALTEALKDLNPAIIYGKTSVKKKDEAVDRFQEDPECGIFILNILAATGLNLTASSDAVYAEYPFSPDKKEQSEDRIHRIGQESQVTVHYTVVQNTLDAEVLSRPLAKAADNLLMLDRR